MPNGGGNPEAVAEKAESPQAPFDDAWTDIQDSAAVDPELGRRYTMLYVAEHGGRTYHDYSAYLKTEDRAGLVDEIVGSLGPRGKAYKDVIAKTLTELGEGSAGVLPDPSRANTSAAAEPIVMFTGGFAHQSDDLHVNGAGIDFIFRRTYRNQSIFFGPMGAGWDHGYDLRLVEAGDVLRLKAGDLREHVYTRHPRFGQSGSDYFVPPDGQHSIVVTAGDSFASRGPDGLMHVFERSGLADVHRLARIEDRYGNQLRFSYRPEDGLLDRVLVNHPGRIVQFDYDPAGRVVAVENRGSCLALPVRRLRRPRCCHDAPNGSLPVRAHDHVRLQHRRDGRRGSAQPHASVRPGGPSLSRERLRQGLRHDRVQPRDG